MSPSEAADRFSASIAAGGSAGELTYDLVAFTALDAAGKIKAIDVLMSQAAMHSDARALETLGFAADSALAARIRPWTQGAPSPARSAARRATLRLAPSPAAIRALEEDMADFPVPVQSTFSAVLLGEVQGATGAQISALYSPTDLARYSACKKLIEHFSLSQEYAAFFGRLRTLVNLLNTPLPSAWREAADILTPLFRELEAGREPARLDLGYAPGKQAAAVPGILAALNDRQGMLLDTDIMRALDGDDAEWLRAQLVFRMSDNRDRRALDALVAVQPRGWRTFLEEEEARETAARHGIGDSAWLTALRDALSQPL